MANPYDDLFEDITVTPGATPAEAGVTYAAPSTTPPATPPSMPSTAASSDENPYDSLFDPVDIDKVPPKPNSVWASMGDALVEGATYGLDKHLYAQFGQTREDTEKQRRANLKRHYWPVQASYVLGSLASSMIPHTWIGRIPVAGKALNAILPNVNIGRSIAAPGTNLAAGTLLKEGAKGSAKAAVLYGLGDTNEENLRGGVVNRAQDIAGQAALAALVGGPLNLAGARASRWLGERGEDLARTVSTARRTGGTPTLAGRTEALKAMQRDGIKRVEDVIDVSLPRISYRPGGRTGPVAEMPLGPRMAALEAHSQAMSSGQGVRAANVLARRAYQQAAQQEGINLSNAQVSEQVRKLVARDVQQNAIPINPTEATAIATDTPAKNTFMAYQRGVNAPGEAGNEAAAFAQTRQAGMGQQLENIISDAPTVQYVSQRARELQNAKDPYRVLFDHINRNPTDDAVLGLRERLREGVEQTRQEIDDLFRARMDDTAEAQQARDIFNRKFYRDVMEAEGQPPLMLDESGRPYYLMDDYRNPQVDSSGNFITPTTLEGYEGAVTQSVPRDSLEALKSARSDLQRMIDESFRPGGNGALGERLQMIKRTLDQRLRQAGADPDDEGSRLLGDYFAINDNFRRAAQNKEAYELGAKGFSLSTGSGGKSLQNQEVLARFEGNAPSRNMDEYERVWFQRGVMAQVEAMISKMPGTHNPAKKFGDRQTRESIRRIFGEATLEELDRQVQRVNLASRSYGADKNSNTAANLNQAQEQSQLLELAKSVAQPWNLPGAAYGYFRQERQRQLQDAMMNYLGAVNTGDPHLYYPAMRELLEAQRIQQQVHGNMISQGAYRGAAAVPPFIASRGADEEF